MTTVVVHSCARISEKTRPHYDGEVWWRKLVITALEGFCYFPVVPTTSQVQGIGHSRRVWSVFTNMTKVIGCDTEPVHGWWPGTGTPEEAYHGPRKLTFDIPTGGKPLLVLSYLCSLEEALSSGATCQRYTTVAKELFIRKARFADRSVIDLECVAKSSYLVFHLLTISS